MKAHNKTSRSLANDINSISRFRSIAVVRLARGLTRIAQRRPVHAELVEAPKYGLDWLGPNGPGFVMPIMPLGVNGAGPHQFLGEPPTKRAIRPN